MRALGPRFTEEAFTFLRDLAANNNREWFNERKTRFQSVLEAPFLDLLETLTNRLEDAPVALRGGAKTMFRMNRDVRFSKDKSPYKTAVSGLLTPTGTKSEGDGVVYVELGADGGFAAAGFHKLSPKELGPKRDLVLAHPERFTAAVASLRDAGFGLATGDSLTTMPRGYEPHAEHDLAWALRLKSFIAMDQIPKSAFLEGEAADRIEALARATTPMFILFSDRDTD